LAIDLKQFHDVFYEEAEEHLSAMERLLLNLDLMRPDAEDINGIFRAAHSIKGGANMFGFSEISGVTHAMETVFDGVRGGVLDISGEIIDTVLRGGDAVRGALAAQRAGGSVDAAGALAIASQLEKIASAKRSATVAGPAPAAADIPAPRGALAPGPTVPVPGVSSGGGQSVTGQTQSADFGLFVDHLPERPEASTAARGAESAGVEPTSPAGAHAAGIAENLSIRVSTRKIDRLIDLVGELVIGHSILRREHEVRMSDSIDALALGLANVERNLRDLQDAALAIRMIPIAFVFNRFPRMVRDLAQKLGKKIELTVAGEATELDKALIEKITDPLTHLIRNAIDHGIEMPGARMAAGKPEIGRVTLRANHLGGSIVIEVIDDGRGLPRDSILAIARQRGIAVSDSMSDSQVWQIIFAPGFSTAEQITDISGRGVGMDVVRRNIHEMGGRVEVHTTPNAGTRISIKLPLTLAILEGMSVRVGKEIFIIPLSHITESLRPTAASVSTVAGRGRVVVVRGEYLPVISLADAFNLPGDTQRYDDGILVILEAEGGKTALLIDELMGQHQVVIKSLETNYRKVAGVSGATIMGDGRVALILDAAHIVGLCHSRLDRAA
jgi:two-component system, chemotaxis family, sensor kinase CheA